MDVVIPTIRDLEFLREWRPYFEDHHLIIVQDGNPNRKISVPEGFDYDLYNWDDIENDLGEDKWIISRKDSACRSYGFLKSNSRYVFTIDDDCFPAKDPKGNTINPIIQHGENLRTNSHPSFFNTLYDQEFVRGYPFSKRVGVPTAISHGLWLNIPDFDAPTQMVRPNWRNNKYVDIVQTIPYESLFPMCGMNLAFDSKLIGPAMYFGLMGNQYPWGRYDDMWAGWCAKTICDQLSYGVKTGLPYIWHNKASDWQTNFIKEHKGILWQEKIIPLFKDIKLESSNSIDAYFELSAFVEDELGKINEYFIKLSQAMRIWINYWEMYH